MVAFAGSTYAARSTLIFVRNGTYVVTSFTLVLKFQKGRSNNLYRRKDGCSSCDSNFDFLNGEDCGIGIHNCTRNGGSVDCSSGIQLAFSGIEAVLANVTVLDMLGTLLKDNIGYDLKHLFIGSEGSLGIVTKVSIFTPPKLSSVNITFLACENYLSCQVLNHSGVRNPLPSTMHKFYVLIETTGSNLMTSYSAKVLGYGLMGDGNLHLNISTSQYDDAVNSRLSFFVNLDGFLYGCGENNQGSLWLCIFKYL